MAGKDLSMGDGLWRTILTHESFLTREAELRELISRTYGGAAEAEERKHLYWLLGHVQRLGRTSSATEEGWQAEEAEHERYAESACERAAEHDPEAEAFERYEDGMGLIQPEEAFEQAGRGEDHTTLNCDRGNHEDCFGYVAPLVYAASRPCACACHEQRGRNYKVAESAAKRSQGHDEEVAAR